MAALTAIGASMCAGSLFVLVRRALRLRRAIPAGAVVIRIEMVLEARPIGRFDRVLVPRAAPIIQFRTADKVDVVARLPPTKCGRYWHGQRVCLHYDPRDPWYIVRSQVDAWRDLLPFLLIGTSCFVGVLWLR